MPHPEDQVRAVATEAQHRLDEIFHRTPASQLAGTAFDQAGLRDGLSIVDEYLRTGELGLAYDHLLYMVMNTDLPLAESSIVALQEVATALGNPAPRIRVAAD